MNLKKIGVVFAAGAVLAACQTDETDTGETEVDQIEETEDTNGEDLDTQEDEAALDEDPDEAVISDEDMAPVSDEDLDNAEAVDDLSQYEEFEQQDVFVPEDYDAYLVSEEGGRRIFVFTEDGEQVFKSIYVTPDNQLQIIDLVNDELLMNDPI
ncbi:MAG: hypothetical protein JJU01_02805 [Alkalibacterium sp.]|nr:hypothetical protein [Alkalibacterium sp.]TVP93069.1 MAG: hypothetical protein EA249_01030 [Alkalibacterium sp.]